MDCRGGLCRCANNFAARIANGYKKVLHRTFAVCKREIATKEGRSNNLAAARADRLTFVRLPGNAENFSRPD